MLRVIKQQLVVIIHMLSVGTTAAGNGSHSEGQSTIGGQFSHAGGQNSSANGQTHLSMVIIHKQIIQIR
jgi:hypothetical protein